MPRAVSIVWNLNPYGLRNGARWLGRAVSYRLWLHLTVPGRRERLFDKLHNADTEGYLSEEELALPKGSIHYAPVRPRRLHAAICKLLINPSEFTFIDVGCGKGRALLLAEELGFARIVGVEYSQELSAAARRNAPSAEVLNIDAAIYRFPAEPSVVFLYNPFWSPTIDIVAENLNRSLKDSSRELYVVYLNPFCESVFLCQSNLELLCRSENDFALFRSRPR